MSQKASKSNTTHDGEIDGSEQGLTNPDKTGAKIDASDEAAHDDSMPSASEDEARGQAARKQEDADDLPTHNGEIDGSEQGLTNPDKTGAKIDASDEAAHDDSMPSASEDEARGQAARKQEDADDLPSKP